LKKNKTHHNFKTYQHQAGTYAKILKLQIGNHPPRNNKTVRFEIINTCIYSPRNKKANTIPGYSTLNPETNSDSDSAKSKGALYVSAKIAISQIINILKPHQ
jgi:hypothetical protein